MAAAMIWIALVVFVALVILVITNRIAGRTYVGKALLAFDYFASVLWSRDFDLTISSQCGLYWRRGSPPLFWSLLHRALDVLQPGHCELAMTADLARAQAAIKLLS
jgi:hypothetical protein